MINASNEGIWVEFWRKKNLLSNCRQVLKYVKTNPLNIILDDFSIWLLGYRTKFSCLYLPHRHNFISTVWIKSTGWRHIWSFKRCLERMYDLNVTMQRLGSLRIISSNTHSLESGELLEIRCECEWQPLHNGEYWTCEIRLIRILESLTA